MRPVSDLFAGVVGTVVTAYLRVRKSAAMQAATRKPGAFAGLDPEHVWIESEGRKLACLLIRGEPGRGVWLLAHGLGENRWQMASRAAWFRGRGYSVMLMDFRAHGESDWGPVAFGRLEAADVDAAVRFMEEELPGEAVSYCGVSLGAAAGLMSRSAGRFERLILELPYRRLEDAVMERARRWLTPLSFPVARAYARRLEREAPGADPVEAAKELRGRVLVLAGARDRYSPVEQARDVARAAEVELVEFAGLGHQNLHRLAREEWERVVGAWLATAVNITHEMPDELVGTWLVDASGGVAGDQATNRIWELVRHRFTRIAERDDGWTVLYRDPETMTYWELTFPHGELQAGGPPKLTKLSAELLGQRYTGLPKIEI